jgi:hypothetical protein
LHENYDFIMDINEINVELSETFQRYVNECCESESDGNINGFNTGYCKHRGGASPLLYDISLDIILVVALYGAVW